MLEIQQLHVESNKIYICILCFCLQLLLSTLGSQGSAEAYLSSIYPSIYMCVCVCEWHVFKSC